jgi:hypothetical protein
VRVLFRMHVESSQLIQRSWDGGMVRAELVVCSCAAGCFFAGVH